MAKKKVEKLSPKEIAQSRLNELQEEVVRSGQPTYSFKIGDKVICGHLADCVVDEILEDGKIIGITYNHTQRRTGSCVCETVASYRYAPWYSVRPLTETNTSFTKNEDLQMRYVQQDIASLIMKHYSFGINYSPDYQRGSVWTLEDKVSLIESIFLGADIGKFVFACYDTQDWKKTNCNYEIIDGKQRLLTLIEFYENRFAYKGKYYNDLSAADKATIRSKVVSVCELEDYSKETILRIFIMLNRGGRPVDDSIIENAKKLLEQEQKR